MYRYVARIYFAITFYSGKWVGCRTKLIELQGHFPGRETILIVRCFLLLRPANETSGARSTGGETCRISLVQWVRRAYIYTLTYKTTTRTHMHVYTHTILPVVFKNRELCHYTWRRPCVYLSRLDLWTTGFIFDWMKTKWRRITWREMWNKMIVFCFLGRIGPSHSRRVINQITVV